MNYKVEIYFSHKHAGYNERNMSVSAMVEKCESLDENVLDETITGK